MIVGKIYRDPTTLHIGEPVTVVQPDGLELTATARRCFYTTEEKAFEGNVDPLDYLIDVADPELYQLPFSQTPMPGHWTWPLQWRTV